MGRTTCATVIVTMALAVGQLARTAAAADADVDSNASCAAGEEPTSPPFVVQGGFILYLIGALYSLWALAYVCEDFLVPAVEVFCRRWEVPDSVAGSLVMAACNDTPEIFVSFLGIFVQKSGIGIGTIIGSEIFNHMMISAGSAYYAKGGVLQLNGRQFTRDCAGYCLSLVIFLWAVGAKLAHTFDRATWTDCLNVTLGSAIALVACQLLYCVVVAKYETICRSLGMGADDEAAAGLGDKASIGTDARGEVVPGRDHRSSSSVGGSKMDAGALQSNPMYSRVAVSTADDAGVSGGHVLEVADAERGEGAQDDGPAGAMRGMVQGVSGLKRGRLSGSNSSANSPTPTGAEALASADSDSFLSLLGSACLLVLWYAVLPLRMVLDGTVPNVGSEHHTDDGSSSGTSSPTPTGTAIAEATERRERRYPTTILVATLWLSVFAYTLCECLSVLGVYFHINSVVMGLTFSAIGTSFPNLWSSLVVARQGKGDMAISNALGSNTFNIFMALGLPWLTYAALHGPYRQLQDGGIVYLTSLLLIVLLVYYAVVWANSWRLYSWMWIPFTVVYVVIIGICCTVN